MGESWLIITLLFSWPQSVQAVGLNAPDGEREKLVTPVKLEGPVEADRFGEWVKWVPPKMAGRMPNIEENHRTSLGKIVLNFDPFSRRT